ncbi:MAG TPA: SIMPL domain-containing protein [Firmicutes bacterium]|jgi:hypothetical protein|nr:SIMPL domain-containing protein [Bacillota bacterium]HAW71344.1 SIMPL domain-containing protein [Bacillota bacterium]HAZ21874.1 SIMPL domain-containing protein [Bacillota bacterium]HBG44596.1 SIMPL domain-containing protein [Bacillota bacterium]HBL49027.1 SIMPL domain-containing protein [Bacillota bacterium]
MRVDNNKLPVICGLFLLVALALVILVAQPGIAKTRTASAEDPREIHVTGEGIVSVKPDIAYLSLGVESKGATAKEAQQSNNRIATKLIEALKAMGIAEADFATQNLQLYPETRYDSKTNQSILIGYRSSHILRVTVRDIDQTGAVIDALTNVGGNVVQNISFGLADDTSVRDQAIEKAVQDATHKAEILARASGVKLTGVMLISDNTVTPVQPLQNYRKEMASVAADAQIAVGSIDVQAAVQMVFGF